MSAERRRTGVHAARARARGAGARADLAQSDGGRGRGRGTARWWARASTRGRARRTPRSEALADGGRARAGRHALRDARAVQPPRPHAALRARGHPRRESRAGRVGARAIPIPRVTGGGAAVLRAAGIEVATAVLEARRRARSNRAFFTAMRRQRPHVTLKAAMTLDGKIATFDGALAVDHRRGGARGGAPPAQRERRDRGRHRHRAARRSRAHRAPRREPWPREPYRVVLDSRRPHCRLDARVIQAGTPARALVAVSEAAPPRRAWRRSRRPAPPCSPVTAREGRVDVADLARAPLRARRARRAASRAAARCTRRFLDAGLVDRVAALRGPDCCSAARTRPRPVGGAGATLKRRRCASTRLDGAPARRRLAHRSRRARSRPTPRSGLDVHGHRARRSGRVRAVTRGRRDVARLDVGARRHARGQRARRQRGRQRRLPHGGGARGRTASPSTWARRRWRAPPSAGSRAGDTVNLERPLRLGGLVGGHLVQGHVDGDRDGGGGVTRVESTARVTDRMAGPRRWPRC